jgi:hypothetical protein
MSSLDSMISHIRDREYMSGINRDRLRVKATAEVFTPTYCVNQILDELNEEFFTDYTKVILETSCGDGQFLGEILIRRLQNGIDFESAISTIYGVEKELDNCEMTRERLLCGRKDLSHIVERNIVCHDALTYDYSFNGTNKNNDELVFDQLFDKDELVNVLGEK